MDSASSHEEGGALEEDVSAGTKGGRLFAPDMFPVLFDKVVEVLGLNKQRVPGAATSDRMGGLQMCFPLRRTHFSFVSVLPPAD